jgi:hypothetical protein
LKKPPAAKRERNLKIELLPLSFTSEVRYDGCSLSDEMSETEETRLEDFGIITFTGSSSVVEGVDLVDKLGVDEAVSEAMRLKNSFSGQTKRYQTICDGFVPREIFFTRLKCARDDESGTYRSRRFFVSETRIPSVTTHAINEVQRSEKDFKIGGRASIFKKLKVFKLSVSSRSIRVFI